MSLKNFLQAKFSSPMRVLQVSDGSSYRTKSWSARSASRPVLRPRALALLAICIALPLAAGVPDLAVDSRGNLLIVADTEKFVRVVGADGRLSTLLGSSGERLSFDQGLTALAIDSRSQDTFVSDFDEIFRITAHGEVAVVAGNPSLVDSGVAVREGQVPTEVALRDIVALAYDSLSETLYAAEYGGRILAIQHGAIRQHPRVESSGTGRGGSMAGKPRFGLPIRDIALGLDGSLYVAAHDRVWNIHSDGVTVAPVASRLLGADTPLPKEISGPQLPSIFGLAALDEQLYASVSGAEILRIGPDGNTEVYASSQVSAGRIEFDGRGRLLHLFGDPDAFTVVEIRSDGSTSRLFPAKKPIADLEQRRIIGGTRVPRNELQAVVQVDKSRGGACSGSLIASSWVLTAIHCVQDDTGASYGPFTVSVCNQVPDDCTYANVPVSRVHTHPDYRHRGFLRLSDLPSYIRELLPPELIHEDVGELPFDVALLKLERPIVNVTPFVVADFTTEQALTLDRTEAIQVGWGNTHYSYNQQRYPDHKRMITTPIRQAEQCRDALVHSAAVRQVAVALDSEEFLESINSLHDPVWNHRVCAGSPRSPVELASWGDSGSPLLVRRNGDLVQIGVMSSSRPRLDLTSADFLNVYIRTAAVYDWIDQVTGISRNRGNQVNNDDALIQDLSRFSECSGCPAMVALPAGSFEMGAPTSEAGSSQNERPQQSVTIPRRIAVGVHEVTYRQWYRCVADGGCSQRPNDSMMESDRPVAGVSYRDMIEYTAWLSQKTGRPYRLLTEPEWEYAARAGTSTAYYTGNDISSSQANYGSSYRYGATKPVGSYDPNPWGLYDMAGNIEELVQDCYHDTLEGTDRMGRAWHMSGCSQRVLRGGTWYRHESHVRSAFRARVPYRHRDSTFGFRVARTLQDGTNILAPADDHGDQQSAATRLELGANLAGLIELGNDEDWFRLVVSQRTAIAIYTTGRMDTVGSLRDGSNQEIREDDDSGANQNFHIETTLGPGTYYVRVTSYSSGTGSYTLHAERTGGSSVLPERYTNSIGMEFALVPAGEFTMGSTDPRANDDESPLTSVQISQPLYVGVHEVTQGQWQAVMGNNPSGFPNCGSDCPIEKVSWDDVKEFIDRLNAMEDGARSRLLTEAEWEYAARAGTTGERYSSSANEISWNRENSGERTHRVGEKSPNAFGLYDMLGNVWEWVQDRYGAYPGGNATDPIGPRSGSRRVIRGGGWPTPSSDLRVAYRYSLTPQARFVDVGFRLARVPDVSTPPASRDDHADDRSAATRLTLGSNVRGRIGTGDDEDWFRLDLAERTAVAIYTTGSLDTVGSLRDSSNRTVKSNDNWGTDTNFRIEATLGRGSHYIRLTSRSSAIGRYTLHAESTEDEPIVADLTYDFEFEGIKVGTIERITIADDESDASRLSLTVGARLNDFSTTFDQIFGGFRLPWDSCQNRAFLAGNTRVRSTGEYLRFSTNVRYERWQCWLIRTRLFSITRSVVLRVNIKPGPIDELSFGIDVQNVEGVWDWLEDRILGLRNSYSYPLPIPWAELGSSCSLSEVTRILRPRLEGTQFSMDGDDVLVVAEFSMNKDLARASRCLP